MVLYQKLTLTVSKCIFNFFNVFATEKLLVDVDKSMTNHIHKLSQGR